MHVAANDSILSFFIAFGSTSFSYIYSRSLSCNLRMLNSTCGCLVPIFATSTLGSGGIKVKRFQERSILPRETCKENAQSGVLWVPFHSCSHTQKTCTQYESFYLAQRHRQTERHKHRHKNGYTQTHTRRHTCRYTNTYPHS